MSTLTGLDYLLEHASFADKEAREKTEARLNIMVNYFFMRDDAQLSKIVPEMKFTEAQSLICRALNGDQSARVSLGMEKGE